MIDVKDIGYVGIYLTSPKEVAGKHVTLRFFPRDTDEKDKLEFIKKLPIGKSVSVTAKKYGAHPSEEPEKIKNFGYMVELPEDLNEFFAGKIPHVTLGVKNGGKPVDTFRAFNGEGKCKSVSHQEFRGEVAAFFYKGGHTINKSEISSIGKTASKLFVISNLLEKDGLFRCAKMVKRLAMDSLTSIREDEMLTKKNKVEKMLSRISKEMYKEGLTRCAMMVKAAKFKYNKKKNKEDEKIEKCRCDMKKCRINKTMEEELRRIGYSEEDARKLSKEDVREQIKRLDISYKNIVGLPVLCCFPQLEELYADGTLIDGIDGNGLEELIHLPNLKKLTLRETPMKDVSFLSNCSNLELLEIDKTNVEDISPLAKCLKLRTLSFSDTPVSNIDCLADFKNLRFLNMTRTNVTDYSALLMMPSLRKVCGVKKDSPVGKRLIKRGIIVLNYC